MTVALLIVGEISPKTFAAKHADRLALWLGRPVAWGAAGVGPVVRILSLISDLLVRPLGGRVNLASPPVTEEGVRPLVRMGEEEGGIEADEGRRVHSIIGF